MGKTVVVIGSQWGDEGKGKITNYLSEQSDWVVRYQGGDNAGHTIVFDNNTYKLQLLPSGVFNPKTKNVLGNGMVINPKSLVNEIKTIQSRGFSVNNIYISDRAHVIFDYHRELDRLNEERLGDAKIGTTKKGIGPAYTDKVARFGIRMGDFVSEDFKAIFTQKATLKNEEIVHLGGEALDIESMLSEYLEIADFLRPFVCDTIWLINQAYEQGDKILFEGAQGALLDIDFGTYPYVTSSNPSSGGVAIGSGMGVTRIDEVLGVVKAYTTRVGEGPFPTEIFGEIATRIREIGREYGTVTKRPRRIGYFDGVLLKYSAMVNGLTGLSIMLLDVLSGLDEVKICTAYEFNGEKIGRVPARLSDYEKCKPVYITLPGWQEDIQGVSAFSELPENAQKYLKKIEEVVGVPIVCFSVGPDRKQTIMMKEMF